MSIALGPFRLLEEELQRKDGNDDLGLLPSLLSVVDFGLLDSKDGGVRMITNGRIRRERKCCLQ